MTQSMKSRIMLLTHRDEFREQLKKALHATGYEVAIPLHREDMLSVLRDAEPHLIIVDLYMSDPSGAEDLKILRHHGYEGAIVVISGPPMISVIKETYASGVDGVVQVPATVKGKFDFGELQTTITTCLKEDFRTTRKHRYALIARRAYELYEAGGRLGGRDVQDWLQAEQEIPVR